MSLQNYKLKWRKKEIAGMNWDMSWENEVIHMTTILDFWGLMSVFNLPLESCSKHHTSPSYSSPLKQQPAARQIPTQTAGRWNINTARTQSKEGMWSLESFRKFYCRRTCVSIADGSNYGIKNVALSWKPNSNSVSSC